MTGHHLTADEILATIGLGRWQLAGFCSLVLFYFSWCHALLGIIVLGFVPDFACLPPDIGAVAADQPLNLSYGQTCLWYNVTTNTSGPCAGGYMYAEPKTASIVSEWDLVCGKAFLSEVSQTVFTAGLGVGTLVFTPVADKFGRRKIVLWVHVAFLAVSLLNCVAVDITTFIVARFFLGTFLAGTGMVSWVVTLELFVPEHRTIAALTSNVVWGVCTCSLSGLAYVMKGLSWRYLQLAMSSLSAIIIAQFFFVDEPIRWLMANGREQETIAVIRKAGRMNRVKPDKISALISRFLSQDNTLREGVDSKQETNVGRDMSNGVGKLDHGTDEADVSALELIKHPTLRRITLVMSLAWFTNSMTYIGLFMLSSTMSGDRYLNLFLASAAEIPSSMLVFPVILKCGRKKVLVCLHLLAGISLIAAAVLHVTVGGYAGYVAVTAVVLLGKFAITGTFNIIFMYTPEVFPTNIRSLGVGATSAASRVGGLLSPFAVTIAREVPWLPAAVFGGFCILVALACPLLPETRGRDLPQTLEDLDNLYLLQQDKTEKEIALKDMK